MNLEEKEQFLEVIKKIIMNPEFPNERIEIEPLSDVVISGAKRGIESYLRLEEMHETRKDIAGWSLRELYEEFQSNTK